MKRPSPDSADILPFMLLSEASSVEMLLFDPLYDTGFAAIPPFISQCESYSDAILPSIPLLWSWFCCHSPLFCYTNLILLLSVCPSVLAWPFIPSAFFPSLDVHPIWSRWSSRSAVSSTVWNRLYWPSRFSFVYELNFAVIFLPVFRYLAFPAFRFPDIVWPPAFYLSTIRYTFFCIPHTTFSQRCAYFGQIVSFRLMFHPSFSDHPAFSHRGSLH